MLNNMRKDVRTLGYVLRRTNYGEADRILDIITPEGKLSVMARGVRKERSKLAGGVELFTLTDFNIHLGKSELGVLTGAKMVKHYSDIIKDFDKIELAAMVLKRVSKVAGDTENAEYFRVVDQGLMALNDGDDLGLIEAWALLNIKKAMGEEVNLYRDLAGKKLSSEVSYRWDEIEQTFVEDANGRYGADEIKLLRLIISSDWGMVRRVRLESGMVERILWLARTVV
ncbi:MAG: DNA repair protein RecO [Candidatus Saccharibacteria bacterium]|uniref:DNA repair protein RecO n=1 Tax=Candidatus Nanosyncoccus alces TaxID=2171997 RepID=A0ABY0FPD0_9BACT|nr:DNA repair protein RecO [Candidatus Nanosyncoccus alces]MDO4399140.1 DNA repair protein RecO [Candidatus Saccharibacteria bacterium]RYC75138.1 DNA repair protein RecO [Candidatus Nanosyncoccus alces]